MCVCVCVCATSHTLQARPECAQRHTPRRASARARLRTLQARAEPAPRGGGLPAPLSSAPHRYAQLPRFLFGHSLGGAISILMANATTASAAFAADGAPAPAAPPLSWTGVILSAPAIVPDPKVKTPLKVFIGKALASVLPKFALAPLPASGISTNQQVRRLTTRPQQSTPHKRIPNHTHAHTTHTPTPYAIHAHVRNLYPPHPTP